MLTRCSTNPSIRRCTLSCLMRSSRTMPSGTLSLMQSKQSPRLERRQHGHRSSCRRTSRLLSALLHGCVSRVCCSLDPFAQSSGSGTVG
ncbi:hypothetical protein FR483_n654L [Paramecium bursaria Chlorella virus FR483]|uniref:Uncharacterized protein n654L n=1 Tax=Paramecium bursaria Chlorella virus FR483 TaxID=399781 RepID=A7J808_PBCVF|nr:hypothetical protein FR483_n654L [Paramecium bursaria Chlorella virus FR483]ABT15939.1 hypothetical protein FR483_n654L [Paramecium bursaria Chlorella virus FR483]